MPAPNRLNPRLVNAARTRMQASMGYLSLRQALLYDRQAGLTDLDVGRWLQRGEELRARGAHEDDADLTPHDRLCLELVGMDSARGNRALLYAGEAAARILTSTEPKMAGHQVQIIKHVHEVFGEDASAAALVGVERRSEMDIPQTTIDLMTEDEVREYEALAAARATATAGIRALAARVAQRGAGDGAIVH